MDLSLIESFYKNIARNIINILTSKPQGQHMNYHTYDTRLFHEGRTKTIKRKHKQLTT